MHSSRMRTVRCSGRPGGGGGDVYPGRVYTSTPRGQTPVKTHNLSATTVADGSNLSQVCTFVRGITFELLKLGTSFLVYIKDCIAKFSPTVT